MGSVSHPVSLERYFFTRSIVTTVDSHKPGEAVLSVSPENQINLAFIENNPGRYEVTMKSTFNSIGEATAPYVIDMECVGLFSVDSSLAVEEATKAVMVTAHNVLYAAIREAVAWITGRQPFGQLIFGLSVLQSPAVPPSPRLNK